MRVKFKIQYKRADGGYSGKEEGLNSYLARHHIISYPFMQIYTIVTAWYCTNNNEMREKFNKFLKDRSPYRYDETNVLYKKLKEKTEIYLDMNETGWSDILNKVCWAESNLFIGPGGLYRMDDPSQKKEKFPLSMDKQQMQLANNVISAWNSISNAAIVGEKDQFIEFTLKKADSKGVEKFVAAFLAYINCTKDIYVTRYDDWVAVPIGEKGSYTFRVKTDNGMAVRNDWEKNDKIKNFKFRLRDKAATENEPVVCITSFNHQKGYAKGVLKDRRGMNEDEKRNFQNKWM